MLAGTTYGHDLHAGQGLEAAQHCVVESLVWNLRVLAGWAPREGVAVLRAMVAWLEVANTVDHLLAMEGRVVAEPYRLGGLATAWPRLREAGDVAALRSVLAASPWGDPGGDSPREIALAMQAAGADRLVSVVPEAAPWAMGGVALLMARDLASDRGPLPAGMRTAAARVVGSRAASASRLADLRAALPRGASWALEGVEEPAGLWRAEARWWRRVDRDATALVGRSTPGRAVLVGAAAVLAADALRVRTALEVAARGGDVGEDADAVA
jgi:hypothetical protein